VLRGYLYQLEWYRDPSSLNEGSFCVFNKFNIKKVRDFNGKIFSTSNRKKMAKNMGR